MSLRRQAMDHRKHDESFKTISRKAKARLMLNADLEPFLSAHNSRSASRAASNDGSRPGSRHASVPSSRVGSRVGSRLPSPESTNRELDLDDETSENSLSDEQAWEEHKLQRLVTSMKDRNFWKGAYEERLRIVRSAANHICSSPEDSDHILTEVFSIFVKCITKDSGDVGRHASRAVAAMAMFSSLPNIFAAVDMPLRNLISNSMSAEAKETALHAYGVIAYFGGTDIHEVTRAMEFLLEIIKSDGESVNSLDSVEAVCAAMGGWAFLSTLLDPDELAYYDALEAFEEQLQSSVPAVVITAADGIGLIAEEQYGPQELDAYGNAVISEGGTHTGHESDSSNDPNLSLDYRKEGWTLNYDLFQDRTQPLKNALGELGSSSLRKIKRENRREVHSAVRDARHAIDHPWRGPRFSTVLDSNLESDSSQMLGHRLRKAGMIIDRWWKMQRYIAIGHIVQGGMHDYVNYCTKVREALRGGSMVAPSRFKDSQDDDNEDEELVQRVPEWPMDSDDE